MPAAQRAAKAARVPNVPRPAGRGIRPGRAGTIIPPAMPGRYPAKLGGTGPGRGKAGLWPPPLGGCGLAPGRVLVPSPTYAPEGRGGQGGRLGGQQRPQGRLRWVPAYLAGVGTTAAPEGGTGGQRGQGSGAGRADIAARCPADKPSP